MQNGLSKALKPTYLSLGGGWVGFLSSLTSALFQDIFLPSTGTASRTIFQGLAKKINRQLTEKWKLSTEVRRVGFPKCLVLMIRPFHSELLAYSYGQNSKPNSALPSSNVIFPQSKVYKKFKLVKKYEIYIISHRSRARKALGTKNLHHVRGQRFESQGMRCCKILLGIRNFAIRNNLWGRRRNLCN